jgi:type VI secretion system secreted protein VgrG
MPAPKNGTAASAVAPADPKAPTEADNADPGEVEKIKAQQRGTNEGKYGSLKSDKQPPKANPDPGAQPQKKDHYIEVQLVDEAGKGVAGEVYEIKVPDEEEPRKGTLDEKGLVRIENIAQGQCKISFPNLDQHAWE